MLFELETGYSPPALIPPRELRFSELTEGVSFFVPADFRATPKQTRASIYSAAHSRGIRVRIHKTTKDGAEGFRVFGALKSSP